MKVNKVCWGDLENMVANRMDAAGYDCFDKKSIREYWEKEERLYKPTVARIQCNPVNYVR